MITRRDGELPRVNDRCLSLAQMKLLNSIEGNGENRRLKISGKQKVTARRLEALGLIRLHPDNVVEAIWR